MKKGKNIVLFTLLIVQFFLCYLFHIKSISYFLLSEVFFLYLLKLELPVFIAIIPYLFLDRAQTIVCLAFILIYHFAHKKIKVSLKVSTIVFLTVYFFTARYESYVIKAIMPGFIAFIAIIYSMTRLPSSQKTLAKAILIFSSIAIVYSIFFDFFNVFALTPYFLIAIDIVQLIISTTLYFSLFPLEKKSPYPDNYH